MLIFFYFSSFIFKENHFCIEEDNPKKRIIVEQELDGIFIVDIEKLENLPRLVFIYKECGNADAVVNGRELTRNITKKRIGFQLF